MISQCVHTPGVLASRKADALRISVMAFDHAMKSTCLHEHNAGCHIVAHCAHRLHKSRDEGCQRRFGEQVDIEGIIGVACTAPPVAQMRAMQIVFSTWYRLLQAENES